MFDFKEMPKILHYARISPHTSDWLLQMFSLHKNCPLNGVPCNGSEDQLGFSASCKHCHPSSSSCHKAARAVQASVWVGWKPWSHFKPEFAKRPPHLCSALTCSDFFPRGLPRTVLIQKGVSVGHRLGKYAKISSLFSCALLITKLRCIHC